MTLTFRSGQGLSYHELNRLAAAIAGTYVMPSAAGGAVTPSSGMTVAIAAITAGHAVINSVADATGYAGGTKTAAASDSTKDRIDTVYFDGSTVDIAQGTAVTTSATVFPVPPALAAGQIALANLYITHGATSLSASDIDDRRTLPTSGMRLVGSASAATSTTSTSAVDLVTISSLAIPVTAGIRITFNYRKQALAANEACFGLKLNSTVVAEAAAVVTAVARTSATNQAESGYCVIEIGPRSSANYLSPGFATYATHSGSGGAQGTASAGANYAFGTAPAPNALITSIAIRAKNDTASNAAEVYDVRVYRID